MKGYLPLLLLPWLAVQADVMVPVMQRTLKAGEVISVDVVAMRAVSDSRVFAGTVRDMAELNQMQAAHVLRVGQPITRLQIKPMLDVARDSAVTIRWNKGGVLLEGSGLTLDGGNVGDSVRVLNTASRSVLRARVADKGLVTVQ